jgi:curved DNA-binding protein CbpA
MQALNKILLILILNMMAVASFAQQNVNTILSPQSNYYQKLGVSENASTEEIRKAFRELIEKFHPEKMANVNAEQRRTLKSVLSEATKAASTLVDETSRERYDAARRRVLQTNGNRLDNDFYRRRTANTANGIALEEPKEKKYYNENLNNRRENPARPFEGPTPRSRGGDQFDKSRAQRFMPPEISRTNETGSPAATRNSLVSVQETPSSTNTTNTAQAIDAESNRPDRQAHQRAATAYSRTAGSCENTTLAQKILDLSN